MPDRENGGDFSLLGGRLKQRRTNASSYAERRSGSVEFHAEFLYLSYNQHYE